MAEPKKTTIVELIAMISLKVFKDLAGFFLFMFGLDDLGLMELITLPISAFYLMMKGIRGNYNLIGELLEFIPYVGALPLSTLGFLKDIAKARKKSAAPNKVAPKPETETVGAAAPILND